MKKILFASLFAMSATVFAGIPSWIDFSTVGPDKYADGTTVLDNEVYALVWVKSGSQFAGFNAKGELVDALNNKVICRAAVAKAGRCPAVRYILDNGNQDLVGGDFCVVLLDTRVRAAVSEAATTAGVTSPNGTTTASVFAVNGYEQVVANVTKGSSTMLPEAVSGQGAVASQLPADVPTPVIEGFSLDNGQVLIKVANTVPYIQYTIEGKVNIGEKGNVIATGVNGKEGGINLVVDNPGENRFFKVIRASK